MGKWGSKKKEPNSATGSQRRGSMTLRELSTGKKQSNVNAKTMAKLDHLKNLANWAITEASIPSLAAFFGQRLASSCEALGIPTDPSLFLCERCESVLHPGYNCTVRIEKNKSKTRSGCKKSHIPPQNNVVYTCHFCSHRNMIRGTSKGRMKEICPPEDKPLKTDQAGTPKSNVAESIPQDSSSLPKATEISVEVDRLDKVTPNVIAIEDSLTSSPATPSSTTGLTLLESKMKKRNRSGVKKVAGTGSTPATIEAETTITASSKRKRKSWTSLKEIAESSEQGTGRKSSDLSIPFFI